MLTVCIRRFLCNHLSSVIFLLRTKDGQQFFIVNRTKYNSAKRFLAIEIYACNNTT